MQLPYLRVVHYLRVERGPPRRSCWVGQNPEVRLAEIARLVGIFEP